MSPDIGASDQSLPHASHIAGFSDPPTIRFLFVLKLVHVNVCDLLQQCF